MYSKMTKGNDGRAARRLLLKRLSVVLSCFLGIILLLNYLGIGGNAQQRKTLLSRHNNNNKESKGTRGHGHGPRIINVDLDDEASLDLILSASINLVAISADPSELQTSKQSYSGVYGDFCALNFALHKADPSAVPMFRDLVSHSPDCDKHRYHVDLARVAQLAKKYDAGGDGSVQSLQLSGVVFHESRCGSTLVANALMAMNPKQNRVYSESAPPIAALHSICGETFGRCPVEAAARILQDVMYMMGRSNDAQEKRVFFKIQSVGTRSIQVFQHAFPTTPWIFLYRDPVQVLMSQMAQGPRAANCVQSRRNPPSSIVDIVKRGGFNMKDITNEEYCAAHLSSITESAVAALERAPEVGVAVNYADLPDILYTTILPNQWNIPITAQEVANIVQISSIYSKGRGSQAAEWHEDSERKEEAASAEIRKAAELFLQDSYNLLQGERNHDDVL